jgi:UDP-N-acetylmuramate dehydrogenase
MDLKERFVLRPKTTMRIGGEARYFSELTTKQDAEEALRFSIEKKLKLIPLGSGSNMIFADTVDAFVVQVKHASVAINGDIVTVGAGKNLPMLVNELSLAGLDLSALTGIPGTIGGAIFGNAGQGPKGVWIDSFIESVTVFDGAWKTMTKDECAFRYRESFFKDSASPLLIWEASLRAPKADPAHIKATVESLLRKRIETQPHMKTAGSCFKAVGDTPAWKLIDAAGLRGYVKGGIEISPKHANFLINIGEGTYADAVTLIDEVKRKIPKNLEVEMRFIEPDGSLKF